MAKKLILGLVGAGIQGSRTPAMHRVEGAAQGLDIDYRLLDTARMSSVPPLADILADAEAAGFSGLNVTYPYKREVMGLLDEIADEAREVEAVNTVLFRNGRRIGQNTDVTGFAESLREGLPRADLSCVLVLGAGGAGGAVAHALAASGAGRLLIADLDPGAASRVALSVSRTGRCEASPAPDLIAAASAATGLVNATPMGMAAHPGIAIAPDLIEARHWVADVVYVPLETPFLAAARKKGCPTLSGAGMAVMQAVRAFRLFTGVEADAGRMRATFDLFDRPAV